MKKLLIGLSGFLLTVVLPVPAGWAATTVLSANLSQANEVPPTLSPGTGTAIVTLDTIAQTLHVQVAFSGLGSGTTASHIHCCLASPLLPGVNVGVATTTPTFANFPLGVTSGTYDNTLDLTLASSYNPAFVTAQGGTRRGRGSARKRIGVGRDLSEHPHHEFSEWGDTGIFISCP